MNRTTEGSKARAIIVGGDTIALEDGRIEMPPEQAKISEKVLDNIIIGNFQEIKMEKSIYHHQITLLVNLIKY